MNASVAVNLFVKAVIREQRIPFEITTAPNQDTRAAIEETEKDLTSRKLKSYANVDEMMKELLS